MTLTEAVVLIAAAAITAAVVYALRQRPTPMPPVGFIFANSHNEANRYLARNALFGYGVITPRCVDRIRGHLRPHIIVIGELADDFDLYDWPILAVAAPFVERKGTDAVR